MNLRTGALSSGVVACAVLVAACSGTAMDESTGEASSALEGDCNNKDGKHLFNDALPGTNGRACATCHVQSEHTALSPGHVAAMLASDPGNPLFNAMDADDPGAATPTYNHLKVGLVRVTISLADNLDVLDASGNVVTNAQRTISVWRGVPTIENTAYTAPYQYDGRAATLETQGDAALHAHSQIDHEPSKEVLHRLSDYERTLFSSHAAEEVADAIEDGETPPALLPHFPPGSVRGAGEVLFKNICAQCHGTGTGNVMTSTAVHNQSFAVINPDGSVTPSTILPSGVALAAAYHLDFASKHQINIGIAALTGLAQVGALPNLTGVDFPQYHLRFYTNGSRTTKLMDLPPPPPLISPSLVPQPFSVDPGRALVTGDINDWEDFDIPQLRGVAHTAPYFHDCSVPDLPTVLDFYSRLILPAFPALNRPYAYPPEGPGLPPEALTKSEKTQLLAYLQEL